MCEVFEQLIIGGKNRKIVTTAIIKQVSKIISHYRPCHFRPKGIIYSVEQWFNGSIPSQMEGSWIKEIIPEHSVSFKKPNHINSDQASKQKNDLIKNCHATPPFNKY